MDNTVAHHLREFNRLRAKEQIEQDAIRIVEEYIVEHPLTSEMQLSEHYHAINSVLKVSFNTSYKFSLARRGFLKTIREYNRINHTQLDEPVVPVLAERDSLTIGYDWFVKGSRVFQASKTMINIWQRKRKFSVNDLVESVIYSSVMYGGLNDIDALKALYEWLFSEREIYKIIMSAQTDILSDNVELLALIPLTIKDDNYGCAPYKSNTLEDLSNNGLQRYVEYIPDDITLSFLYALKDQKLGNNKINSFETIISNISKKLKLQNKDINKPHLSQFVRYANYNWRQTEGNQIDNALSVVKHGIVMTTSLSTDRVLNYNQEVINLDPEPLMWSDLFDAAYKPLRENRGANRAYPNFSKNLIKEIQDALKGTKQLAIDRIKLLQFEFPQPNAERILGWILSLLEDSKNRLETISKYSGCIGRDWLMLTMDEDLNDWHSEDFEEIYEQIIQSKIKDGRRESILCKESEFDKDDIDNTLIDIAEDECEKDKISTVADESISDNKVSYLDKLKNSQKFTYGRLRAFHDYQRGHHDAPYVYFPWGNNRQVVKANMISPRIYNSMKKYLNTSALEPEQKRLCLVILSVAYRTGMRINELIGIKVSDVADMYTDRLGQKAESPKIMLRPNSYRRLKSSSAKRMIPIDCLLKKDEIELFSELYHYQKRLRYRYLFAQGSGDQPLPHVFFSNLMKVMWDRLLLNNHDFTFHSLRHTAISQLALVLNQSPLAQLMTDYDVEHCDAIVEGVLANNKAQGTWFGLASFVGHLTPDTTFEYYIHTAHLLAGWQLSQAKLMLPLTVLEATTGINYQIVNRQDATAYDGTTKQVLLYKLRSYMLNKLAHNKLSLLSDIKEEEEISQFNQHLEEASLMENGTALTQSVLIHDKYFDVIALLEELQEVDVNKRDDQLAEVAIRHGINASEANLLYHRASQLFNDDRLLLGSPTGKKNQEVLKALDRAYRMATEESEQLQEFVKIFSTKQNQSTSSIHFGIKGSQLEMLKVFLETGCKLVDSSQWQIRSNSEQVVRDIKKELGLDSQIRTGARQNFHGYEVRIVQKKRKLSNKNLAITDDYYASSGVLKYLGYLLMILTKGIE